MLSLLLLIQFKSNDNCRNYVGIHREKKRKKRKNNTNHVTKLEELYQERQAVFVQLLI